MNKFNFKDLIVLLPIISLFIPLYDWFLGYNGRVSQPVVIFGLTLSVVSILLAIFILERAKRAGVITLAGLSIFLIFATGLFSGHNPVMASFDCNGRNFVVSKNMQAGYNLYLDEGVLYTNNAKTNFVDGKPSDFIEFNEKPSEDLKSDLESCFDVNISTL